MERRAVYQMITEVKSAPTGVDWLMIMAARKSIATEVFPKTDQRGLCVGKIGKRSSRTE